MKLFFHPGTDMAQAMAETINYVNRSRAFMPPGTVAPFVMRFDTGSVPSATWSWQPRTRVDDRQAAGMALFDVRADLRQPAQGCPRRHPLEAASARSC